MKRWIGFTIATLRPEFAFRLRFRRTVHPQNNGVKPYMGFSAWQTPGMARIGRLCQFPAPRAPKSRRWRRVLQHLDCSSPFVDQVCSPLRPRLPRRARRVPRQGLDPPRHRSEKPPRQVTGRPPVFTNRCCNLVNLQLPTRSGSTSRRHRFPRL